jgi:hypothetical protein
VKDNGNDYSPIDTNNLGQVSHKSLQLLKSQWEEPASQYEQRHVHNGISSSVVYIYETCSVKLNGSYFKTLYF